MRTSIRFAFSGLSALCLALAIGCGGGSSSSSGGGGGDGGPGGTGTAKDTWLTDSGEIKDVPRPTLAVSGVFRSPPDRWSEIAGTYHAATGTFEIKDVPDGPYYLRVGKDDYYVTTARAGIDLGRVNGRRPDAQVITTSPTNLALDLTNVTAWQGADKLELYSLGGGAWDDLTRWAPAPPMAGATMLAAFTSDLGKLTSPGLIDGGKGDKVTLTHLTSRVAGSGSYVAIGQALSLPSLTLSDGQAAMSGGAFQDVPQTNVTVDFKASAFAPLVAAAGPGATAVSYRVHAWLEPGGKDRVSYGAKATLLDHADKLPTDAVLSLDFGNPFPPSWGVIASAEVDYDVTESAPGPLNQVSASISVTGPLESLLQGPVVPQIAPPTGVTIGGMPATSDLMGVGAAPVFAWSAPAMGTPNHYTVRIYSFPTTLVASLYTTDTTLIVPSGILQSGKSYAAAIMASTEVLDFNAPYRGSPTGAAASYVTRLFTP